MRKSLISPSPCEGASHYAPILTLPEDLLGPIAQMAGSLAIVRLWCCGTRYLNSKLASSSGIRSFEHIESFTMRIEWYPTCISAFKGLRTLRLISLRSAIQIGHMASIPKFTHQHLLDLPEGLECLDFQFRGSAQIFKCGQSSFFNFKLHFPALKSLTVIGESYASMEYDPWSASFVANHAALLPPSLTYLQIRLGVLAERIIDFTEHLPVAIETLILGDLELVHWVNLCRLPFLHTLRLPSCRVWDFPSDPELRMPLFALTTLEMVSYANSLRGRDTRYCVESLEFVPNLTQLQCEREEEEITFPQLGSFPHLRDLCLPLKHFWGYKTLVLDPAHLSKLTSLRLQKVQLSLDMKTFLKALSPNLTILALPHTEEIEIKDFGILPARLESFTARWTDPNGPTSKYSLPASLTSLTQLVAAETYQDPTVIPSQSTLASLPTSLKYFQQIDRYPYLNHSSLIQSAGYDTKEFPGLFHSGWSDITIAIDNDIPELVDAIFNLMSFPLTASQFSSLVKRAIKHDSIHTIQYMHSKDMLPKRYFRADTLAKMAKNDQKKLKNLGGDRSNPSSSTNHWKFPNPDPYHPRGFNDIVDDYLETAFQSKASKVLDWFLGVRGFCFSPYFRIYEMRYPIHTEAKEGNIEALETLWRNGFKELEWLSPFEDPIRPTTPLDLAISGKKWDAMVWLFNHGARALGDLRAYPPPALGLGSLSSFLGSCRTSGATAAHIKVITAILKANELC